MQSPDFKHPHVQENPELVRPEPAGRIATNFTQNVENDGYAWWYIDGISDDGLSAFTVIAFIGSVFSPYYARARRRAKTKRPRQSGVRPEEHVAINAVLYGNGGIGGSKRWAMTERGASKLQRTQHSFAVGPSSLLWDESSGRTLEIKIDERCAPFGQRLRGTIRVDIEETNSVGYCLNKNGQHFWQPIAPKARASVDFSNPGVSWRGSAYVDHNHGAAPLEDDFRYWSWSRSHAGNDTEITYEIWQRDGRHKLIQASVDAANQLTPAPFDPESGDTEGPVARTILPRTGWRVLRDTRVADPQVVRTLEDTPFYTRTAVRSAQESKASTVCESLDLDRFNSRWVQALLGFRMPRISR